jgi:cation:H+ antiporter
MEELLIHHISDYSTLVLLVIIAITLYTLSKGADILVDEAVSLSVHWGVPKMIIGATIVSLGTTLPEATVSVMAAVNGNPDLALGNAVGSIICDTSLIIGISSLLGELKVDPFTIRRQGKLQLGAGLLLILASMPFLGGYVSQFAGFVFLALLATYIIMSLHWSKGSTESDEEIEEEESSVFIQVTKMIAGIILIILSSKVLIPTVEITAIRVGVPQSIIAATLVAFGTSLPELVTAISSVRKGHGELAIGNIVGADILNVLFVVGASASVTRGGLLVPNEFYTLQFPVMAVALLVFRYLSTRKVNRISKVGGSVLLLIYVGYLIMNYL